MSWRVIARRDALDPYRSRSLFVYLTVFVLLFGLGTYLQTSSETALAAMHVSTVGVFVPVASVVVGYQAIVKRRENGALRVVLSFPHTRREVVLGTAVGRSVVAAVLITTGFLVATAVYLLRAGVPDLGLLALAWLLALLIGVAMAAFAVGVSASVRTTNRAVVTCFGAFMAFLGIWGQIPALARYVANGFSMPPGPQPEWALVFTHLNPITAYRTTMATLLPGGASTDPAFYATPWFGVLVLLAWIVVPLAIGATRFDRDDL